MNFTVERVFLILFVWSFNNAVSYLNKGLPSPYLGRGNNNTFLLVQNTLPWKNLIIAQIHKSGKGMLLQYNSGTALVRDADIEMAKVIVC